MVLEDGAQGFGGRYFGKMNCSFGEISTTSFFPAKPLGCYGDGGAIFTDDENYYTCLCSLRSQGKSPTDKYDNREIGINSRLDTIQAAILLAKLDHFANQELSAVNRAAKLYTERLKRRFITPIVPEGYYSSWAQYTILTENREERDSLQLKLKKLSIPTMVYYPRGLHQQKAFSRLNLSDELFPNTLEATKRVLSLPMHPYLTENSITEITDALLS